MIRHFQKNGHIEREFMFMTKNKNLDSLILECQKYGSYYTVQTIMGYIEHILANTRNMGYTVAFIKLKNNIASSNIQKSSLRNLYKEIIKVIDNHNMNTPEALELRHFIIKLQENSVY